MAEAYKNNSITLPGAVAMGTGVMIGAGIFALTGQIAELAGPLFPLSVVVGAFVTAFSAYTYIKPIRPISSMLARRNRHASIAAPNSCIRNGRLSQ